MKLPKSEKAQMYFSFVLVVVGLLLFYGLPPVLAQAFADHSVQQMSGASHAPYYPQAVTVNLPPGQKFMYIIPKEEAAKLGLARPNRDIYVTYENQKTSSVIMNMASPRLIRFLQAGNTPGSWEEVLYIQERDH